MAALLLFFFATVLAGITGAGYWLVLRPGRAALGSTAKHGTDRSNWQQEMTAWLSRAGGSLPTARPEESVRGLLEAAGYRWQTAAPVFNGITYLSAAMAAIGMLALLILGDAEWLVGLPALLCAAGIGFLLPKMLLSRLAENRGVRLTRALPAALDLLVLSIEVGQSLDQALADTARELKRAHVDLASEFSFVHHGLKVGKARDQVFRDLVTRNRCLELRKLSTLLLDSDRFGSALAPALRSHAQYLRVRRKQEAQEAARKVGVKLIFPIFFLIFPSILLVTLGPALIQIATELMPMLASF